MSRSSPALSSFPLRASAASWCAVAALAFGMVATASAQERFPNKPVRLVVGFGAGGPTDIPARYIADKLGEALGQRVVVENKPAASGMIATRDVLSQPKDGHTLLLCTHFESINTAIYKNPGFNLADLAPISQVSQYYYGVAVTNEIPAADLAAFVAYAKARPGEVSYATIGAGSAQDILSRQLEKLAGITMNRIPFRTGPQVMPELIAGRVHLYMSPTLAVLPLHDEKKLKVLGISSPQRLSSAPQIPTLKENGMDYVRSGWLAICAAAGTPQPVIDLLNRHIVAIVATAEYRTMIEKTGSLAVSSTPAELWKVIIQTRDDVASTIEEFGLRQE
jgi:tripartite-type tricarboxylate transporter receptor subunit TctC